MLYDKKKYWFIFYCKSRTEKKIHELLLDNNYNTYLPLLQEIHQWSDRKKKVLVPMFRGYIFVNSMYHEVHKIVKFDNIVAPLKIGNEFGKLRQTDIDLLKKIEKYGIHASAERISVHKGDFVEIQYGPLRGYSGTCIQELGQNYVLIAIDAIEHFVKVKVHKGEILKVK